jgi:hypothetical protein
MALCVLFSVDSDDPDTPAVPATDLVGDEGGVTTASLSASTIYLSNMLGQYVALADYTADIDAIAAADVPLPVELMGAVLTWVFAQGRWSECLLGRFHTARRSRVAQASGGARANGVRANRGEEMRPKRRRSSPDPERDPAQAPAIRRPARGPRRASS